MIFRDIPPPRGEFGISTEKRPASEMGGQRRALGAALLLDHLHQQDLSAANHFLTLVIAQVARGHAPLTRFVTAVGLAANGFGGRGFRDRVGVVVARVGVVFGVGLGRRVRWVRQRQGIRVVVCRAGFQRPAAGILYHDHRLCAVAGRVWLLVGVRRPMVRRPRLRRIMLGCTVPGRIMLGRVMLGRVMLGRVMRRRLVRGSRVVGCDMLYRVELGGMVPRILVLSGVVPRSLVAGSPLDGRVRRDMVMLGSLGCGASGRQILPVALLRRVARGDCRRRISKLQGFRDGRGDAIGWGLDRIGRLRSGVNRGQCGTSGNTFAQVTGAQVTGAQVTGAEVAGAQVTGSYKARGIVGRGGCHATRHAIAGADQRRVALGLRPQLLRGTVVQHLGAGARFVAGCNRCRLRRGRPRRQCGRPTCQFAIDFLFLALGLFGLLVDQALPVGDRDLIVVGMDLAEGEEAVAVAAILDEGRLEAWLYANHLGKIDVALELSFGRCLDVEILETVTVQHHHAGFFRVCSVDQHALGHSGLNSGVPPEIVARPLIGRAASGGWKGLRERARPAGDRMQRSACQPRH